MDDINDRHGYLPITLDDLVNPPSKAHMLLRRNNLTVFGDLALGRKALICAHQLFFFGSLCIFPETILPS